MRRLQPHTGTPAAGVVALAAAAALVAPSTGARAAAEPVPTSFAPIADTYVVDINKGANFGTRTALSVDGSAIKRTFVAFTVADITEPITRATLRLHVDDVAGAGSDVGGTWTLISDTTWSESLVTWNNQPAIDGATLGVLGPVVRNSWVEIDVTGLITGNGSYSIGGTSSSADGVEYDARESGDTAPQLVITTGVIPPSDPVLVGAGDIATDRPGDTKTAALINALPDAAVFTAGDNVQVTGAASDFSDFYDPTWGAFKSRTHPVPGNHDYKTPGATPYYDYFGTLAGPIGLGYYSYDLGDWHIVALNSEIAMAKGSDQEVWLRADLAANPRSCSLAYWHRPLYTSGAVHKPAIATRPLFRALYDNGAELVLSGHNHQYERFAPMDPLGVLDPTRGLRQFVVGTGGASHYAFGTVQPNSEIRDNVAFGVLKLTLHTDGYDWEFLPIAGQTFTDSGSGACH